MVIDTPPALNDNVLAAFDKSDVVAADGHARHPGAEEPQAHPRDPRPDRRSRASASPSCSTAPTRRWASRSARSRRRSRRRSSRRSRQPGRARLDQPRRAAQHRGPEAPGLAGDPPVRRPIRGAAGRQTSSPRKCVSTDAAAAAGGSKHMSLTDRLAQARRQRGDAALAPATSAGRHRSGSADPIAELKRAVHAALLENLGPQLYDSRLTEDELEAKVRSTLQTVLALDETPMTVTDRARLTQEIADDILGLRAARAVPARPGHHRDHGQRPEHDLHRAQRQDRGGRGRVHRRQPPAPHHRQDRRTGRSPRRRVVADGRRPAARRQPRQRGDPAARHRRPDADDPQVRRRPVRVRGPRRVRHLHHDGRRVPVRRASGRSST